MLQYYGTGMEKDFSYSRDSGRCIWYAFPLLIVGVTADMGMIEVAN